MKVPTDRHGGILTQREYVVVLLKTFGVGALVGGLLTVWVLIALGRL